MPQLLDRKANKQTFDWVGLAASVVQDIAVPLAKTGSEVLADEGVPFLRSVVSTASGVASGQSLGDAAAAATASERQLKLNAAVAKLKLAEQELSEFDLESGKVALETASAEAAQLEEAVRSAEEGLALGPLLELEAVQSREETVRDLLAAVRDSVEQVGLTLQSQGVPVPEVATTWPSSAVDQEITQGPLDSQDWSLDPDDQDASADDGSSSSSPATTTVLSSTQGSGGSDEASLMAEALSLKVTLSAIDARAKFWSWKTAASPEAVRPIVTAIGKVARDLNAALKGLEETARSRAAAETQLALSLALVRDAKLAQEAKAAEEAALEEAYAQVAQRRAALVSTVDARRKQVGVLEGLQRPKGVLGQGNEGGGRS